MTSFKLAFADQDVAFDVARRLPTDARQGDVFYVSFNGRTVPCRLRFHQGSRFVLEVIEPDGKRRQIRAAGTAKADDRQLWVNGQTLSYRRARQRQRQAEQEGSLTTTIPAIVTQILVSPGDTVSIGEKLLLLESMKMIIPIQAPYDGTVTAVRCRVGEPVQAGALLIELIPKGEE
jgi:3-methylcrotonyl-CoA carboxylase alpha subunit